MQQYDITLTNEVLGGNHEFRTSCSRRSYCALLLYAQSSSPPSTFASFIAQSPRARSRISLDPFPLPNSHSVHLIRVERGCAWGYDCCLLKPLRSLPLLAHHKVAMSDVDDELLALAGGDSDDEASGNESRGGSPSPPPAKGSSSKKGAGKKSRRGNDDSEEEGEA